MLALCLSIAFVFSGCVSSVEMELMQAPRPAVRYQQLQTQIDALLTGTTTYSPPSAGENRQAVQLRDLNGDGDEVAILFLRAESECRIVVFLPQEDGYAALPPVTENAESVHRASFDDFDGDGRQEIIVGWQTAGLRSVSVYKLGDGGLTEILSKPYNDFILYDIEGEGHPALLLFQVDATKKTGVVDMYADRGNGLEPVSSAFLSQGVEAVKRIRTSPLTDGRPGLLVASQYLTADSEVTDVFTFRDDDLVNISMKMESRVSETLVRQNKISAVDINNDGVIDLPRPVELPRHPGEDESSDPYYEVHWSAYDSNGMSVDTARTYNSLSNNWYLILPENWPENYTVRRVAASTAQTSTTFSALLEDGTAVDFLTISYITRSAGDRTPIRDRTVLVDQNTLLVVAEIIPMKDKLAQYNIGGAEIKTLFKLITADWRG